MLKYFFTAVIILASAASCFSQLYQGPAIGSVASGQIVNTGTIMNILGEPLPPSIRLSPRNKYPINKLPDYMNKTSPSAPEGSNYFQDPSVKKNPKESSDPILIKSFLGFMDPGNYIPPDQYMAAGPQHIVAVDNGRFRIFNKNGTLLKSIPINTWFSITAAGSVFDPKISYDQFSKRWIMVWLSQDDATQRSYYLLSVSHDSIPLGTWYNWSLPSNVNGSTPSGGWGDYEGVGFDDKAIYLTSNQFSFSGYFQGSKIRIIEKSQLYNNTAGAVYWTDLWNIKDPVSYSTNFGIRPAIHLSSSDDFYLMCTSPYNTGTYFSLYKISNSTTTPVMTGVNIPVTQYSAPYGANQLGGSSILIETGDDGLRNEPVYKDGYIWCVHQVKSGTNGAYSGIRYLKINTSTYQAEEDAVMGADGYWMYYPALTVDKDMNVGITFCRSGITEYIGAFYTTRLASMPPNTLTGSHLIQAGKGNYVKDFGSGRNRWGDYNGLWVDPADRNSFWAITEYAEAPANLWASQISMFRAVPFQKSYLVSDVDTLTFHTREVNSSSDTLSVSITNFGMDSLLISAATFSSSQFSALLPSSLPITIGYNQSKQIKIVMYPVSEGTYYDSLVLRSNAGNTANKSIYLKGKNFSIHPTSDNSFYAITGSQSNGNLLLVNDTSGSAIALGSSGYSNITGLTIRLSDKTLFGCIPNSSVTTILRLNAKKGDAYPSFEIPVSNVSSIVFDTDSILYFCKVDGTLFKFNTVTKDTAMIGNTGISNLYSIAINPLNGQMWGLSLLNKIYKIDKVTAGSRLIGTPGFQITPSIAFDYKGNLYGTSGLGVNVCNLIKYDTLSGTASLIGSMGFQAVRALAISGSSPVVIPADFRLYQNYPNPFNPSTTIQFDLPRTIFVSLKIYDIAGREVATLANSVFQAGTYKITWNSSSASSGIYFCRIKAGDYNNSIRMIYVK
jgi:hypothetical protein